MNPPRVLRVNAEYPEPETMAIAATAMRNGELVAFPTETVYGLGARIFDPRAIEGVYRVKGRPRTHPLIAHVVDEAQAMTLAASWPDAASTLAASLWPGPLTVIVDRAAHVPAPVAGGGDSIAIRAPAHPVARALIAAVGDPIAAPSANRYQQLSPTTAEHAIKGLGCDVAIVLDAGPCSRGIESTVVDVRAGRVRILRPGPIGLTTLRAICPNVENADERVREGEHRPSPGQDARHYSPRAKLILATRGTIAEEVLRRRVHDSADVSSATRIAVLCIESAIACSADRVHVLPGAADACAQQLFAVLHELDDAHFDVVIVEEVPASEVWRGVADRLRRAAAAE